MSKKQKKIFWPGLFASTLVLAVLAFAHAWPKNNAASPKDLAVANPGQGQAVPAVFTSRIRIWIHGDDIRPKVIRTWPGAVLLTTENLTDGNTSLVVERVLPGQAFGLTARLPTRAGTKRTKQELILAVGEYVFYEESRPLITGRLFVEARGSSLAGVPSAIP